MGGFFIYDTSMEIERRNLMKVWKDSLLKFSLKLAASSPCVWFAYTPEKPDGIDQYNLWK